MTPPDGLAGAALHYRALERLYVAAPVNRLFPSRLEIVGEGRSRLTFTVEPEVFHAAGGLVGRWTAYQDARAAYRGDHRTNPPWSLDELDSIVPNILMGH